MLKCGPANGPHLLFGRVWTRRDVVIAERDVWLKGIDQNGIPDIVMVLQDTPLLRYPAKHG